MRTAVLALLAGSSLLLVASSARAQSCDPADFVATCEQSAPGFLRYCYNNSEALFDCTQVSDSCEVLECVGDGCESAPGSCVALPGDACTVQAPTITSLFAVLCSGTSCLRRLGGEAEESCNLSGNGDCVDGALGVGCDGQIASACLQSGPDAVLSKPILTDCADYSSQCAEGPNGASVCLGGSGAACDDLAARPFSLLRCLPGFTCNGASILNTGTCQSVPDAGPTADSGFVFVDSGPAMDGGGGDGGSVRFDAGAVQADGGFAVLDGGLVQADGGFAIVDGGLVALDGGLVALDGGLVALDGGVVAVDAGQTQMDAGDTDGGGADGGVQPPVDGGATTTPLDGGPFGANACGENDVGALGSCDGNRLRFCQAGSVEEIDCAAVGRVCAEVGPTVGSDCVRPEDAPSDGDDEVTSIFCLCASPGEGPPAAALLLGFLAVTLRRRRRRR